MTQQTTTPVPPPLPLAVFKDGKLYKEVDRGLYTGWELVSEYQMVDPAKARSPRWRGGKISWQLWDEIVAFMRWSQATYKCEALITLFYNRVTREWKAWPFSQHPVGMTIKYETNHELYAPDRRQFGKDWVQLGSVHHHCVSNAFQSNTDASDEEDRDGLHITLGNMNDQKLDIHSRQVFDGFQSIPSLFYWINMPEWVEAVPIQLRYDLFTQAIVYAGLENTTFNDEWKLRVIEKKSTTVQYPNTSRDRNDHVVGNPSGGNSTSTVGKVWRNDRKRELLALCTRLDLSATKAFVLLSENNPQNLRDDESRELRCALITELHKSLVAPLWAEDLLNEISNEEIADAQMGHGV